jgi:nucleotidyltransferase/DNA polymerase involved in DNA repair
MDLTASAGIAPNKFLARSPPIIESPTAWWSQAEEVRDFLRDLPIAKLWGWKSTEEVLKGMGILKAGQLAALPSGKD